MTTSITHEALFFGYLVGWVLAAIGVFVFGQRLRDERKPAPHTLLWSIAAGAMWPVLFVGAIQMSATALLSKWFRNELAVISPERSSRPFVEHTAPADL